MSSIYTKKHKSSPWTGIFIFGSLLASCFLIPYFSSLSLNDVSILNLFLKKPLPEAPTLDYTVLIIHKNILTFCKKIGEPDMRILLGEDVFLLFKNEVEKIHQFFYSYEKTGNFEYKFHFCLEFLSKFHDLQDFLESSLQKKPSKLFISGIVLGSFFATGLLFTGYLM